ncbi:hypothetical protein [Martelella mediterranea]|uniref:Uncharacterized protein n=1 Tax=Martelella mediterranea DSM 17316 TaxID=1122214 RepID=A0A1U9Z7S3_9HYPH|nr:hypothetical protein [Martelella mediterranea]AQZ53767.1 hypothetical protein Mame_04475 [Martelella mediterranea DSM 17316]
MTLSNLLWLFTVAAGPVLLGLAIAYGIAHQRKLTNVEQKQSDEATRELFEANDGKSADENGQVEPTRHPS